MPSRYIKKVKIDATREHTVCIKGEGNYSFIRQADGKILCRAVTLKKYEALVGFYRVSKSIIINLDFIYLFSDGIVLMLNGSAYCVSKRRLKDFTKVVQSIAKQNIFA